MTQEDTRAVQDWRSILSISYVMYCHYWALAVALALALVLARAQKKIKAHYLLITSIIMPFGTLRPALVWLYSHLGHRSTSLAFCPVTGARPGGQELS